MSVEHFDTWYAAMSAQSPRDRVWQEHLRLPPEMVSSSLLSLDGLREVASLLALRPDDVLLDLACGRGGYGMWLARETGCRVVGVDFSAVAVEDARARADDFGLAGRASYVVGDLAATGLDDGSVDAVVCVDAIQFAADAVAACREVRRVLRPGGVAALTTWEALNRDDPVLPDRIRLLDVGGALTAAGFDGVSAVEKPEWLDLERRMWTAILAIDPGDDQALRDTREEAAEISTGLLPRARRILASGRAPL